MHTVDIVIYPNCQLLDVTGPWQVFATANDLLTTPAYDLRLVAAFRGPVGTDAGMSLTATHILGNSPAPDTLLVAGGSGVSVLSDDMIDRLGRVAAATARPGSVCTGAFALARTGLLDGCEATTHWRHATTLARQHPRIKVRTEALYMESGGLFTSAGVTAGIDLALSWVEKDQGTALAGQVARELVLYLRRPGSQRQFSDLQAHHPKNAARLKPLIEQIMAAPLEDWCIETLADRLAVSTRHLSRLFHQEVGTSPGQFITLSRLDVARRRVLTGHQSLAQVAEHCRLGGAEQLRRLFHRHFGLSPSLYHARFGSLEAS